MSCVCLSIISKGGLWREGVTFCEYGTTVAEVAVMNGNEGRDGM